jgi:hypothetical protein
MERGGGRSRGRGSFRGGFGFHVSAKAGRWGAWRAASTGIFWGRIRRMRRRLAAQPVYLPVLSSSRLKLPREGVPRADRAGLHCPVRIPINPFWRGRASGF